MTPIRATWSSFFGSRNSRFESQFRTKTTIYTIQYTVYMQPKKQLKVQYIGIFEEINSFYWPKMHFLKEGQNIRAWVVGLGEKSKISDGVTRSPIELSWTAKKSIFLQKCQYNSFLSCIYTVYHIVYIVFLVLNWLSNLEFWLPKKKDQVAQIGVRGGVR